MSVWARRRARALRLASETPHAAEILRTYADLLSAQERIAERVPERQWLALAEADGDAPPRLRLDRLPADDLAPLFRDFLALTTQVGTEVMRAEAASLAAASGAQGLDVSRTLSTGAGPPEEDAPFHACAFLQSVATALACGGDREEGYSGRLCFVCGGGPVVGIFEDRPDALGSRSLVCGICGSAWRLARLTCAYCGQDDADELAVHTAESLEHVRLDACRSCGRYLKTIDLRRRGDAVPVVDDLATLELDLWARDQGLARGQRNLFGT